MFLKLIHPIIITHHTYHTTSLPMQQPVEGRQHQVHLLPMGRLDFVRLPLQDRTPLPQALGLVQQFLAAPRLLRGQPFFEPGVFCDYFLDLLDVVLAAVEHHDLLLECVFLQLVDFVQLLLQAQELLAVAGGRVHEDAVQALLAGALGEVAGLRF